MLNQNQTLQPHVLVVDDEPAIVNFIRTSLKIQGYQVTTASGGREALKSIEVEKPDIMVLDVVMPEMSGLEVLRELRAYSQLPVIILSAMTAARGSSEPGC